MHYAAAVDLTHVSVYFENVIFQKAFFHMYIFFITKTCAQIQIYFHIYPWGDHYCVS